MGGKSAAPQAIGSGALYQGQGQQPAPPPSMPGFAQPWSPGGSTRQPNVSTWLSNSTPTPGRFGGGDQFGGMGAYGMGESKFAGRGVGAEGLDPNSALALARNPQAIQAAHAEFSSIQDPVQQAQWLQAHPQMQAGMVAHGLLDNATINNLRGGGGGLRQF